ncbi:hypothetical protein [Streptomyces sp. 142MFCol3.1]|uniref:hypothetical protein n=1 Tax=Streptomyces sp. 142MFCol3.1 TaxID=1172179 RepID=UPI00131A014C|nr:hypothetical protein [Streptomyces sp. 142MFCol3.1]
MAGKHQGTVFTQVRVELVMSQKDPRQRTLVLDLAYTREPKPEPDEDEDQDEEF